MKFNLEKLVVPILISASALLPLSCASQLAQKVGEGIADKFLDVEYPPIPKERRQEELQNTINYIRRGGDLLTASTIFARINGREGAEGCYDVYLMMLDSQQFHSTQLAIVGCLQRSHYKFPENKLERCKEVEEKYNYRFSKEFLENFESQKTN